MWNNPCCNFSWGEECDSLNNAFIFKLFDGTSNQWHDTHTEEKKVEEADRKAKITFPGLKVFHQYECGVKVETSGGVLTSADIISTETQMPEGIQLCTQPMITL